MTVVYVDMVADLFHFGHVNFLRAARAHGDYLKVGIHSDAVVESYKRTPILTMEERIGAVEGCRYVDQVIPNAPISVTREWLSQHQVDVVVHGDDFDDRLRELCYKAPIEMGIFRTVSYTPGISTSEIIDRCRAAKTD